VFQIPQAIWGLGRPARVYVPFLSFLPPSRPTPSRGPGGEGGGLGAALRVRLDGGAAWDRGAMGSDSARRR